MSEPPHDDPTRRLTPATPPPPPVQREVLVEPDPAAAYATLLERVRSLQRWLALVAVLALAGLGAALYALLSEDEEGDGRGASRTSVRRLDDRVDALDDRVRGRATKGALAGVRRDQDKLKGRVDDLAEQAGDGADAESVQQANEELADRVDELEQRVEAAEQAAEQAGESPP